MNRLENEPATASLIDEQFLRRMLHDLSAPVRHVRFFAAQLNESLGPIAERGDVPADTMESIEVLERAGEAMSGLLDQVRALVNAVAEPPTTETSDIGQVVQAAWQESAEQHPNVSASLNWVAHTTRRVPESAWITILRCLFDNCLRNACPDVPLAVTVTVDENQLSVADNGTGINPEDWDEALRPFQRLKSTPTMRPGLGLTVVSVIAKRQGCELSLIETAEASTCIAIRWPTSAKVSRQPSD